MRTAGNIIWLVLAGIWLSIGYVVAGILNFIVIIGIPFGIQSFKLAGYALWPFGRAVIRKPHTDVSISTLGNVVWFIFGGWFLVLAHLFTAALLMLTIIGIPLGVANIKMAGLALAPFGKQVVPVSSLTPTPAGGQVTSGSTIVSAVRMLEDRHVPELEVPKPTSEPRAIEGPEDA